MARTTQGWSICVKLAVTRSGDVNRPGRLLHSMHDKNTYLALRIGAIDQLLTGSQLLGCSIGTGLSSQ